MKDLKDIVSFNELLKDLKEIKLSNYEGKDKEHYLEFLEALKEVVVYGYIDFNTGIEISESVVTNTYNSEYCFIVAQWFRIGNLYAICFHKINGDVRAGYSDYLLLDEDDFMNIEPYFYDLEEDDDNEN